MAYCEIEAVFDQPNYMTINGVRTLRVYQARITNPSVSPYILTFCPIVGGSASNTFQCSWDEIALEGATYGTPEELLSNLLDFGIGEAFITAGGGSDIPDGSITTAKLADKSVTADKIAPNTITNEQIADKSINADEKIADLTVDNSILADGAVTTAKIADGAVTPAKLAPTT